MSSIVMPDHDGQEGNYKNVLNALCQRLTGHSMSKTDITYETVRHGAQFQSTAILTCLEAQQSAGELCDTDKAAEQSAAYQGVIGLEAELEALGYSLQERTLEIPAAVRQAAIQAGIFSAISAAQDIQDAMTDSSIKGMMNAILAQVLERKCEGGEVAYEFSGVTGGLHVATLKLQMLEGELGRCTWTGTASPFKRDAQLDCALKAMESILTDPTYAEKINLEGAVNIRSSSEKKQKEKEAKRNKKQEAMESGEYVPSPKGKGKGKGGKGCGKMGGGKMPGGGGMVMCGPEEIKMLAMMRMMMMGGGSGKGGGKGSKGKGAGPY